jgi:hypothetical protein
LLRTANVQEEFSLTVPWIPKVHRKNLLGDGKTATGKKQKQIPNIACFSIFFPKEGTVIVRKESGH